MEEDNIYEYEGTSYSESALREAYPDTFDDYVSEGILLKKESEEVVEDEIQQDTEAEVVGSVYEYDGNLYGENALREAYPDTFDDYVSQGILVKKDEPKVDVEEAPFTAFKSQEENTLIEEMFGKNVITNAIGDTYRAINAGLAQSDAVDPTMDLMIAGDDATDRQLYEYIRINKELAKNQKIQDEMAAWDKAVDENGGGAYGILMATIENPGIAVPLMASSLATMVGSLQSEEVIAATVAGAGASAAVTGGIGAAATAATGGIAAPVAVGATALAALRGGQAALQATMEATLTFNELLQEEIEGELTFENVKAVLSDPEKLSELRTKAIARGSIIGAVDYITFGIANKFTGAALKAVKKGTSVASRAAIKTGAVVGGTAIEGAGGGAGEAAARFAIGQDMDIKEIALETIGEFGGAALSVGPAAYNNLKVVSGRVQANKTAKDGGYKNTSSVFAPDTDIDQATIDLASNKNTSSIVDEQVEIEVANGRMTQEEADTIKENFRATQGAVNTANKIGRLSKENKPEVVNLLMEEKKLKDKIKDVDNASLTKIESNRLKEVQSRLEEIGNIEEESTSIEIDVTDSEYKDFVDNGNVTDERLNSLAQKVKDNTELTEKEQAIFNDKTSEVEEILKTFTEPTVEEAALETTQPTSEVDNIDYIDETLYNKNVNQTPEGTEFINVYRAEGKVVDTENLPLSVRGNAGSWFTPFKAEAERYAAMGNRKVYKIAIPKALYDNLLEGRKGDVAMSKGEIQLPRNISSLKTEVSKPTQQTSEVEAKKPKATKTTKSKPTKTTKAKPTVETKSKTKSQVESKTKEIADVVAQRKKEREKYKEDSDKNFDEREKIKDDKNLSKEEKQKKIKALEEKRDKIKNSYEKKNNELGDKKNKLEKERQSLEKKYKKESKSEENKRSQKEYSSEVNSEAIKNKIRGQIKNAIKALSNIAKGVTIEVYETQKEYEASGGNPIDGGEYVLATKTIKINLEKANLRTVAHEVFHAILLKDGITNKEAQRITSDMLDAVRRIASPKLLKRLDAFASKYTNGLQSEESISELFGILAENYETSSPVKKLINEWLRKLAKVLNIPIKGMLDSDKDIIEFLSVVSQKVASGEVIEQADIDILQSTAPIGNPTIINKPSLEKRKQIDFKESYKMSLVTSKDKIDLISLIDDIIKKNQKVWFWVADQLGLGEYEGVQMDAGPSFALQPENRKKKAIWASGLDDVKLNKNIKEADFIFIISGSPIVSKLFNKKVFDIYKKKLGDYESFKEKALATNPVKGIKETLEEFDSWADMRKSTRRKAFLIAVNEQFKKPNTKFHKLVQELGGFVDLNELRDGFYKENNFSQNDIMLVLKPTKLGGKSKHSTYSTDILGELVGVPDIKMNAEEIMPTDIKEKISGKGISEKTSSIAPYGGAVPSAVKNITAPETRKQIIGENAELSQNVRDNLSVARQMETDNKDAKTIRIATGWERGADGKWRYEIDDITITGDVTPWTDEWEGAQGYVTKLKNIVSGELLKLYPQIGEKVFVGRGLTSDASFGTMAQMLKRRNGWDIFMSDGIFNGDVEFGKSVLLHEIQHIIQDIEGFERGGNSGMFDNEMDTLRFSNVNALRSFAKDVAIKNPEKGWDITYGSDAVKKYEEIFGEKPSPTVVTLASVLEQQLSRGIDVDETTVYKTLKNNNLTSFEKYKRLAGEVESRNVQKRMDMTPEQRRDTTLQETEDVAREDQIFFTDAPETRQQRTTRLAPNGNQSNLTDVQYDTVRTPAFKNWFGDWENDPKNASKVVDENGEPMVVYHGSAADFDVFDKKKLGSLTNTEIAKAGFFFASNKSAADQYAFIGGLQNPFLENKLTEARAFFLNIKNPYKGTNKEWSDLLNWASNGSRKYDSPTALKKANKEFKEFLLKENFDGVDFDNGLEIVAFEPTQAKLADGTNTTFDPDAPSIRQQKATLLTDELTGSGLTEAEIIKQGYLEFFNSMKDRAEDADFIYSEFVEEALDRMQSKINRIRETFKNKISRNKEARKEVRKQIAEILKNSGLDSVSKRAIKSIMKNIENATPATMQKKVAEVMDVISRDIKRQARYNRKKTLGKALSNIGKIGSLKELNNILVDALKINPQYLSDKTLVKYDKIISSLASVSKKFDMPSRIELKSLAEAVITSFQADYKLAQEIIRDRINNNLDPNKSVLENLNQMKKENKITDSEFELLVRFKDQINETKKENVSAEDKAKTAQERRSEATEDFEAAIQGIPKSFKDLNDDERSVLRIVKTLTLKDLENLTTNEIQKLVRGLEGLMAGYIGSDLIQSVDTIKADRLSKNTATGETLERGFIDKLLTRAKTTIMNIFRARDKQVTPIMERIRSTPLKNIDQILNDAAKGFKSTKIYENVFRPTGVAFEAASKKLKMAKKDLDRAGAFLDISRNKRYAQKVKIMIYQIQREYDSNGGKKANAELVTAISMINHTLKDPLVDLSDRERATIEKIRDEYLSIDGEIDADKIFNSFTDKEKKSLALIDKVYSDIQEMARMDAARQGLPFVLRKNYVHLPRITKGQNTMTSEEEFEALADNFANPVSMKSKALFQRNGKPHSISFDPIYNANAISRKATVSYYMVPAVKIGKRVLANLKANAKTDYQKDLFNSLEEVYDSIIRSEYKNVTKDRAFIEKALSFLGRSGYLAQLAGPIKAAVELASNATHAILYNPIAFNEGFQVLSKVPKDTINKALNNLYSTQTARLTENEGGSKDIEERLYASAPLFQQEQMTSDFGDRIGKVFSVLKKPAKAFMKFNEDLITKPDSLVAKPLFIGAFSASFEESTGQKPNWEKIANDENYRNKFDSAIQKASEDGDAAVIDNAASNNPFDAIPKNILDRDASAIKQALQTVNRYMSRFRTFEYYSALKGVQSMIGKGDLTKSQGALLLTATVIRMSMYKMAIDMAFSVVFSLLGLDDEDDEKEIDEEVSKGVLGAIATLALGRYLGNVAQMPVNYGAEWLNREYGEGITFSGDYNAYKDGIVFSKIPMEVKPQDNMISNVVINSLGSYTPMVKTVDRAGKLITRATASKRQETRDRNLDELLTRIPFEIAGNSGVIPGYKTLRKIYNKYLFGAGKNAATSKSNKISRFTGPKLNKSTVPKLNKSTVPKLNKSTVPKLNK